MEGERGRPLVHLNSCIVISVDLVCAHSNCPGRWSALLRLPAMGSVLEWVDTIPAPIHGQAWVFDPSDPDTIWGIQRSTGDIVVGRLR